MGDYVDALRRTLNYAGRSTRRSFLGFVGPMLLLVALAIWVTAAWDMPIAVIRVVVFAHVASLTALLVRRYRDARLPVALACLPWLPFTLNAWVTRYAPDDDVTPMAVGGLFVVGCWVLMVVLACLPSRGARDVVVG